MKQLCIIGGGGHGKVVADIAKLHGKYQKIFFLDDAEISKCGDYPVVGKVQEYSKYTAESEFIVAIGNNEIRKKISEKLLCANAKITSLIHPKSIVARDVKIQSGCVVMAGAVVNSGAIIGEGTILNTCCSVDHDNEIAEYCHISIGAHLAGTVAVGNGTFIGAGAIVKNNISICSEVIVGAGAVVVKDIVEKGTYVGIPAKKMDKKV